MMISINLAINLARGAAPAGKFIFISTGERGLPGQLSTYVLKALRLGEEALPDAGQLRQGFAIRSTSVAELVYIVTVDGQPVEQNLKQNLAAALDQLTIAPGDSLWLPLMGTGVGALTPLQSLHCLLDVLETQHSLHSSGAQITISAPKSIGSTEFAILSQVIRDRAREHHYLVSTPEDVAEAEATVHHFQDETGLLFGRDLWALAEMAVALVPYRKDPYHQLSTTLIVLALANADAPGVPAALSDCAAARWFAQSLKHVAGSGLTTMWENYFSSGTRPGMPPGRPLQPPFPLTKNVASWFANAAQVARTAQRDTVTISDLIEALRVQRTGRVMSVLQEIEVSLEDVFAHFDSLKQAATLAMPSASVVRDCLMDDRANFTDQMDFASYAIAITSFLTSAATRGPISISIQAPWGAGKSSLMQQVRHRLDKTAASAPQPGHARIRDVLKFMNREQPAVAQGAQPALAREQRWTVWFNAWKYESSEQVWAGLVDAIISQVSDRLAPMERELFLLRLNLARIDDGAVRKKIYDRVGTYFWSSARWLMLTGGALVTAALALDRGSPLVIGALSAGGTALAAAFGHAWLKVRAEPASFSLSEYVRVPSYEKSAGVIHEIHRDLRRVIDVMPKHDAGTGGAPVTPALVIFIDDLDRCSPNKVASIVEGINTFLAGDQQEFLFVIGMDPQMVAAALEHAHKDVKSYLPSYEQTSPLGWRFMDKFIQLAFTIPPRRRPTIDGFLTHLIGARQQDAGASPGPGSSSTPSQPQASGAGAGLAGDSPAAQHAQRGADALEGEAARLQQAVSATVTNESEDVRAMLSGITKQFVCSPREIKRILNFVRFVLLLRIGKSARGEPVPELALYERWIILCMRWPDMARWLQWSGDSLRCAPPGALLDGQTAQRLALLEAAAAAPHGTQLMEWSSVAGKNLGLPEQQVSWLANPDLHLFFVAEAGRSADQRLSQGASIGFY